MSPSLPNWLRRRFTRPEPKGAERLEAHPDAGRVSELIDAGIAAEAGGDSELAERLFREAVEADHGSAAAHMNLGIALQSTQDFSAAAKAHEGAVRLDPSLVNAHYNLGLTRLNLDDAQRAEHSFRAALRLRPEFPEAWVGLAEALESTGRDREALAALETAISQREQYVGALFNAAVLLRRMGRLDEAERQLRHIPASHPEFANAMTALAATLRDQGRIDEAVTALRAASHGAPHAWVTQSELLFTLGFSDKVSAEDLFSEHFKAGRRLEEATPRWTRRFANAPDPERVLKIGYLSGDFRAHSVARFTEFLFTRHRRDRVKVYAYSSTPHHDAVTAGIIDAADGWRDLRGQADATVAGAILDDRIDLLVDLAGHTGGSRLAVMAGRAAPVQLTWLGYMNTTGLAEVDYRITDSIADPPGMSEALHTERLVRMPRSQWCFRPPESARAASVARDESLRDFTFGVLNQFAKVSEASISLWIAILRTLPAARLRVVNVPLGSATEKLFRQLSEAGIDPARFDLIERVPHADYYRQYAQVDACLDTTPYSGGTTTCDALFLGVPVVTLAGRRPISRSSASLLTAVGLPEMIAQSPEEFVAIACGLAAKQAWSTDARVALRERMIASSLMDEEGFVQDLEALYRRVWRDWCDAQRPIQSVSF